MGGGRHAEIKEFLLGGGPGDALFWVGDVGDEPPYDKEPGGVPPPCGATDHGENPPEISSGSWHYPLLEDAMITVGTEEMESSVVQ